jgi:hypothetical protein
MFAAVEHSIMSGDERYQPHNWRGEIIVSERVVTVYVRETEEQERARTKAGLPVPTFEYISVLTKSAGRS